MLSREHRLTTGQDFRAASRKGRRAGSRSVVVHLWVPAGDAGEQASGPLRAGFVVSKAVGNAVTRNRVKRRLRHLVRERLASLPGSGLLVVRALPAASAATYGELGADLDRCLERVA
ncbi:ribonuclease P protein component [Nocardioides sp. AE5]|uniref:ribonuclease P protein component n=1 Tax=Nocardioides sp. AE5 TaxID=2962573 RepID=UPI002882409A|nr:ribonuclease P protein component [Nocardioides sp. AE5]MDT0202418.1 ribonuclease P protein component [Nocardioides sp. AE5]